MAPLPLVIAMTLYCWPRWVVSVSAGSGPHDGFVDVAGVDVSVRWAGRCGAGGVVGDRLLAGLDEHRHRGAIVSTRLGVPGRPIGR